MKAKLAILTLALISGVAHAEPNAFEGFNAGLGLGYVQPYVKYTDNLGGYYKWDERDFVPQVDLGYTKAINDKWLVSIGVNADLSKTNAGTTSATYGPVETKIKDHVSVYLQPTYVIDSASAAFAKIGYHTAKVDAIGQPGANWIDDKFRAHGIGYGAGYKRFITDHFFAQAEIQRVDYEKKSFMDGTGYAWDYRQKTTAGILTLGYQF